MSVSLIISLLSLFVALTLAQDPSWDLQKNTYNSMFEPFTLPEATDLYVKPYFSPDHSTDTQTAFLESATESIDIMTPGWSPWTYCTPVGTTCTGCPAAQTREDTFPIFGVLLNALHKGIKVRLMTVNYGDEDCTGMISSLPFLVLNGAEVRYYATTTYLHAKYMAVDGKTVSISSVNYSQTSYTTNREAGAIFEGDSQAIANFTQSVFEYDWNLAQPMTMSQSYNASDLAIITDKTVIPIVQPPPFSAPKAYITPTPTAIEMSKDTPITIYTSPDFAREQILNDMSLANESFAMMIYQVTDMGFCDELYTLSQRLNLTLVVSYYIYSSSDCAAANQCYEYLYGKGMTIHKTPTYYSMSHNKFWIVDGERVSWSTGNWSPTDYTPGDSFPPYGNPNWQDVNRDFTVSITHPEVVDTFQTVLERDAANGYTFTTHYKIQCGSA